MDLGFALVFDPCNTCSKKDMCSMCELTFRRKGAVANSATTTSEWISVEERLPERQGFYFGSTYKGVMMIAPFFPVYADDKPEFRYDITHWMPLPEPPKKGGAE